MLDVRLLIGGEDVPARDGTTFERRDPVTGEVATGIEQFTELRWITVAMQPRHYPI